MAVLAKINDRVTEVIDYWRVLGWMFWKSVTWPLAFNWNGPLGEIFAWGILFLEVGSLWLCWRDPNNPWLIGAGVLLALVYLVLGFLIQVVYSLSSEDDDWS